MVTSVIIALLIVGVFYWCIFSERKNRYMEISTKEVYTIKEIYSTQNNVIYYKLYNVNTNEYYLVTKKYFELNFKSLWG